MVSAQWVFVCLGILPAHPNYQPLYLSVNSSEKHIAAYCILAETFTYLEFAALSPGHILTVADSQSPGQAKGSRWLSTLQLTNEIFLYARSLLPNRGAYTTTLLSRKFEAAARGMMCTAHFVARKDLGLANITKAVCLFTVSKLC